MGNKIQVKRGSGGPGTKLDVGELGWSMNGYLYVGNGIGSQATKINAFDANLLIVTVNELNKLSGIKIGATELNYLKGVTSSVQTQLNGKVPTSREINGYKLESNITLSATDVKARPESWMPSAADVKARPESWMPSATDVGALATKGNQSLTGTLSITNSNQNLPSLSIITGTQSIELFIRNSTFIIDYLKNDTIVNSIKLNSNGVTFNKPVSISSGGTGATNETDALTNLFKKGEVILSSNQYGNDLPTTATAGKLFFKKVAV